MAGELADLQPQIFISHTGQDEHGRIFAASIVQPALEAAGLTTFIDYANLQLGCAWPSELIKAAATSAVFVVVLTQTYPTRFWCLRELDIALHGHPDHPTAAKPHIIPVYMHHPSLLHHVTVEELRSDIQQRLGELAGAEDSVEWRDLTTEQLQSKIQQSELAGAHDSAEWHDLQRLDPERMVRNMQAMKSIQGARRQHQDLHLYATADKQQHEEHKQQQQQQPVLPHSSSSSRAPVVAAVKNEEWVLARKVAAAALKQLPPQQRLAYIPPDLVGYQQQLAEVTAQMVVDEPGTLGLWLHGPGGLGKTTLAHLLFNTLSGTKQFAKAAMVELDLEGSSNEQLNRHLAQLLKGLGEAEPVGSNAQLLQSLAQVVQRHKVLLLLDNVNHDSQLDGLLPLVFSSGSRVIITSRAKALPSSRAYKALSKKDTPTLRHHSMETLDAESAQRMFRQCHGFTEQQLKQQGLCELEEQLLQACSGLPLALQVIGGALSVDADTSANDTRKLWQEVAAFGVGKWTPTDMGSSEALLQGVVYYSFSKLSEAAQNMFLDSISVLQGQPVSKAMLVWDVWWPGQAHQALRRLKQLSLINVKQADGDDWEPPSSMNECLSTLDVIRVLGQSIILKPDRADRLGDSFVGSRIWVDSGGDVRGLIGGQQPVGVNLEGSSPDMSHHMLQHCNLSNVRILISDDMPQTVLCRAPALLWICRPGNYPVLHPGTSLLAASRADTAIRLQTLVVLDLQGPCLSAGWVELADAMVAAAALPSLKALDIDARLLRDCLGENTLQALVSTISCSKSLQQFRVHNVDDQAWVRALTPEHTDLRLLQVQQADDVEDASEKLAPMEELDLGGFKSLQALDLSGLNACRLKSLGNLTALEWLCLPSSGSLSSLPELFGSFTALRRLHLPGCIKLSQLPDSFGGLVALQQLDLSDCDGLCSLPESFGGLHALQELYLSGCGGLSCLPQSFGGLIALKRLDMSCCGGLSSLPESFGDLEALEWLRMSDCDGLCSLPKAFGNLTALTTLLLSGCVGMSNLPESFGGLVALADLSLIDFCGLSSLPESFGSLPALQWLHMSGCSGLPSLPDSFGALTSLILLNLSDCVGLSSLPESFGKLTSLQSLDLSGCGLTSLPKSIGALTALRQLSLSGCTGLSSLPESVGGLAALKQLDMSGCCMLSSLPESLEQLPHLQELQVQGCHLLPDLPQPLAKLTNPHSDSEDG